MKCIQMDRYGGPAMLNHRDIAVPVPQAGELLIRLGHAGINFMGIHTREGKHAASRTYPVALPCTLGMEGAGQGSRRVVARDGRGISVSRVHRASPDAIRSTTSTKCTRRPQSGA